MGGVVLGSGGAGRSGVGRPPGLTALLGKAPCGRWSTGTALPLRLMRARWRGAAGSGRERREIRTDGRHLGFQRIVEHVADLQHAARPLTHAAELPMAELRLG